MARSLEQYSEALEKPLISQAEKRAKAEDTSVSAQSIYRESTHPDLRIEEKLESRLPNDLEPEFVRGFARVQQSIFSGDPNEIREVAKELRSLADL